MTKQDREIEFLALFLFYEIDSLSFSCICSVSMRLFEETGAERGQRMPCRIGFDHVSLQTQIRRR